MINLAAQTTSKYKRQAHAWVYWEREVKTDLTFFLFYQKKKTKKKTWRQDIRLALPRADIFWDTTLAQETSSCKNGQNLLIVVET